MEHIDVLSPKITECPSFVVDNTVNSVDITGLGLVTMEAGHGAVNFERGDSFILLSVGYFIPYGFQVGEYESHGADLFSLPVIRLSARGLISGLNYPFYQFGVSGSMRIPYPNYEMSVGGFISPEDMGVDQGWEFRCLFPWVDLPDSPQISMVNVPAALNGTVIHIVPFVKILHNFALSV